MSIEMIQILNSIQSKELQRSNNRNGYEQSKLCKIETIVLFMNIYNAVIHINYK